MIPAQELVELGLSSADALGAAGCIVLVEESSHVDVRFALNTTTTNGVQRGRSVSVIALASGSVGSARRSGVVGADGVAEMAAAALADAQEAPPAPDAFALVEVAEARPGREFAARRGGDGLRRARGRPLCAVRGVRAGPGPRRGAGRLRGAGRGHALPRQLHRAPSLPRATDGGGEPGRAHGRRERFGLGRRAHDRALARADGAGGLAPARLGHHADPAGGRPLRGDHAALSRERHDGDAGLRRARGPGRRGRPHRLLRGGWRDAGRRDDHPAALLALQRPQRGGHRVHAVRRHRGQRL